MGSYKKTSSDDFPMIGFSFGIDRIIPLITIPNLPKNIKIWVSTIGNIDNALSIKLDIVGKLFDKGYGVFYNLSDRKFKKEIVDADENACNFIVIVGDSERTSNSVTIKNMTKREQITIPFSQIDDYFRNV